MIVISLEMTCLVQKNVFFFGASALKSLKVNLYVSLFMDENDIVIDICARTLRTLCFLIQDIYVPGAWMHYWKDMGNKRDLPQIFQLCELQVSCHIHGKVYNLQM